MLNYYFKTFQHNPRINDTRAGNFYDMHQITHACQIKMEQPRQQNSPHLHCGDIQADDSFYRQFQQEFYLQSKD